MQKSGKPQDTRRKDKVLTVFVSSQEKDFWRWSINTTFFYSHICKEGVLKERCFF